MLEGLYRMQGKPEDAATAAGQVATLRALPPEIVVATGLFVDGELEAAESLIRAYLLKNGDHLEAMRLLARIGIAPVMLLITQTAFIGVLVVSLIYGLRALGI